MNLKTRLLIFRRWLLANFVPEFYWPKTIDVDGVTIKIRHSPYSFGTRWTLCKGRYEPGEREMLREIIRPGMHVIEFGGSIGIVTSVIAKLVGPSGRVVSVEASPVLWKHTRSWLEKPGYLDIVNAYAFPVWKAPQALQVLGFNDDGGNLSGTVSFTASSDTAAAAKPAQKKDEPGVVDLCTLCERFNIQPEALIADIEGSEAIVLTNPPQFPPSLRYIAIELHPWMYPNNERDEQAIADVFAKEGFQFVKKSEQTWLFERK